MPRNSNGNYSLPSGNPVSSNTLIESLWANTTLADVAQGLTESLDRYGRGTMLAAFRVADGTVTAPGVAFGSEASTGIYRSGAGVMGLAVLGVAKATLTASAFTFNTAPTWAADPASANQLTRKSYVDAAIATAGGAFLPLAGGTLTGALNVGIAGTAAAPSLRLNDDNTGLYQVADNEIGFATGGIHRITINVSGISGAGSGLTALNASNLASGTVPDARISGSYTGLVNLTLSGDLQMPGSTPDIYTTVATSRLQLSGGSTSGLGGRLILFGESNAAPNRLDMYAGPTQIAVFSVSGMNLTSGSYSGNGSGLTALNASNLGSGTVPDARISGAYSGVTSLNTTGVITVGAAPNASVRLNPGAATTTGYVAFFDAAGARQGYIGYSPTTGATDTGLIRYRGGTHEFDGAVTNTGSGFTGNGSGLTALNASNLSSGTVPSARLSGDYSHIDRLLIGGGPYVMGGITPDVQINSNSVNGSFGAVRWLNDVSSARLILGKSRGGVGSYTAVQNSDYLGLIQFVGSDGAALSAGPSIQARAQQNWTGAANGSSLNFYTVPNGATTGTIALGLNHDNSADFYGAVSATSFSGSGSGLTSLNASNLSSGTVPNARISGALSGITTLTASGLITAGSFSGSGAALTALDASNLSSGTVPTARVTSVHADATIGGFDIGYRGMPIVSRNSTTAFALTDAGKAIRKSNTTAYTWTINPDATTNFEIGAIIFLLHDSTAGNITVARGTGVALVEGTTDANATLTAGERASIHKVAANRWRIYR